MEIIRGKVSRAQKVIIYGPEGIGKTTLASKFPDVLFIDTEGGTSHMDVARTEAPNSWATLISQVMKVSSTPGLCKTLAIDTADWAERMCKEFVCIKNGFKSIEDPGYGKGYTFLLEEWGKLLALLSAIADGGTNIVLTAHAQMRKFEQPDEMGAYDRWELKLEKKTSAVTKEWADLVLFCNYKTNVVKSSETKTNKATGGQRIMYTSHHPAWDAKNRHDLPDELKMDFSEISHLFGKTEAAKPKKEIFPTLKAAEVVNEIVAPKEDPLSKLPPALKKLMEDNDISEMEIRTVVAAKGYYPVDTPIEKYDQAFIDGVLIAAWDQVHQMVKELLPFETKSL